MLKKRSLKNICVIRAGTPRTLGHELSRNPRGKKSIFEEWSSMFNISNFLIRDVSVIKAVSDFDKSICITPSFFLVQI